MTEGQRPRPLFTISSSAVSTRWTSSWPPTITRTTSAGWPPCGGGTALAFTWTTACPRRRRRTGGCLRRSKRLAVNCSSRPRAGSVLARRSSTFSHRLGSPVGIRMTTRSGCSSNTGCSGSSWPVMPRGASGSGGFGNPRPFFNPSTSPQGESPWVTERGHSHGLEPPAARSGGHRGWGRELVRPPTRRSAGTLSTRIDGDTRLGYDFSQLDAARRNDPTPQP